MDSWDELRTAWQVARLGTVSGAAEVLGVHHATVIRHIDALEKKLGSKLFQRHSRGYTPTEAGRDLLRVADLAADQFGQLAGRIRGQGEEVAGDLVVTSISSLAPLIAMGLSSFRRHYPKVVVRLLTDARVFRLEYGEAHVAIRVGDMPTDPDYVVQPFGSMQTALYASQDYVAARGKPSSVAEFADHIFVGAEGDHTRAPFYRWMAQYVPPEQIFFRGTDPNALTQAVRSGAGIGFVQRHEAESMGELIEVMAPRPEWAVPVWLVTHVDLHRTPKVQAFLNHIKSEARAWREERQLGEDTV